jgi:peptidoglycan-N-acetylglucosamine deacetylase
MRRLWLIAVICAAVVLMSGLLVGAARADGTPVQYIVKPGDALYRIAIQHSVPLTQLAATNSIYNLNYIHAGQVLTIPGDHPAITLSAPTWNADAPSPLTMSGQSDTFEGQVLIRVYDSAYRVVGAGTATGGSNGTYGNFTASVTYTVGITQTGLVEAYFKSAKDGSVMGQADVRVKLTSVTPGPTPPPGPRTYVVQPGDNLFRLALRYNTTIYALANANNIVNVNLIYVGQKLIIP